MKATAKKRGFTLVELLAVVLIIGVLSSIALPQYFKVVEKSRVSEILQWVSSLKGAQELYMMRNGDYSDDLTGLDIDPKALRAYFVATIERGVAKGAPYWSVSLQRNVSVAVYGQYTITFTAPAGGFACPSPCAEDLLPEGSTSTDGKIVNAD